MRVREDGGGTFADIGFDENGWLDEAAIAAHCGANNGYVQTFYDQTGNGRNCTSNSPTAQPQIYDGSVVLKENGKPALVSQATQNLQWFDFTDIAQPNTCFSVAVAGTNGYIYDGIQNVGQNTLYNQTNAIQMWAGAPVLNTGVDVPSQAQSTALFNGATSIVRIDGSQVASGSTGTQPRRGLTVGAYYDGNNPADKVQEIIAYNSDETANFEAIEDDQIDAYNDDLLLDSYPAFAAYSTRQLSKFSTKCMRVRRSSDDAEADIGFSGGLLDETAIATHCGASLGYVDTWYDQSGNARNAIQATLADQPQIYDGSVVLKENGKPACVQQSSATSMAASFAAESQPNTMFLLATASTTGNTYFSADDGTYTNRNLVQLVGGTLRMYAGSGLDGGTVAVDETAQLTALFNTTSSKHRKNGSQVASGDSGSQTLDGLTIMNGKNVSVACKKMQEEPFVPPATSYNNLGGMTNRGTIIAITSTVTYNTGNLSDLVDGSNTKDFLFDTQSVSGKHLTFDFGKEVYIDEITVSQELNVSNGSWQAQGSNNGTDWTNIGGTQTPTNSGASLYWEHVFDLSANVTSRYRYYRLLGVSGTMTTTWKFEYMFKIEAQSGLEVGNRTAEITLLIATQTVSGKHITFDFGSPLVVRRFLPYRELNQTFGTWQMQGSNNGSDWTNIGTSQTPSNSSTQGKWLSALSMTSNTTAYRYYRMLGVSGTMTLTWFFEMDFQIEP
jgi:hypothetical protein